METPHGVDAVIMTRWWTKLTNKDFQHSITSLGVGVCKVNPILPNVNNQSSLCIRPLPSRLPKYFSMITLTRSLGMFREHLSDQNNLTMKLIKHKQLNQRLNNLQSISTKHMKSKIWLAMTTEAGLIPCSPLSPPPWGHTYR